MRGMSSSQMTYLMNGSSVLLILRLPMASIYVSRTRSSMLHFIVQTVFLWERVGTILLAQIMERPKERDGI
ncbi:hypothetical protein C5167_046302 [Papaver somniferum]|uniref:Uncharacterized protein n=1 Tax=Papaver somniferum TaxID=3469 RepID=A0A4Y7LFP6_PAPSO|nr:hypothetical protein C5167_046302 [Papaver somniferum]